MDRPICSLSQPQGIGSTHYHMKFAFTATFRAPKKLKYGASSSVFIGGALGRAPPF